VKPFLLIALAAVSVVVGAEQDLPRRNQRIQSLIVAAAGVPPEFQADTLLRIADDSSIDSAWRRELLDEAFLRAYGAQESYRRYAFGIPPDSRQGAMLAAYDSRLTQVSLQSRAVQMMASVDGSHARELFQWIATGVEATPCADTLVPAINEYYTALSFLARTTFSKSDRGEALRFLEYYLWRAHLPSEMPSVAQAVQRFQPSPEEAAYLELVLRFIFEGGVRDPRGFSVSSLDVVTRVGDLEDAMFEIGLTGPQLSRALREYLLTHLTGARCMDSASEPVTAQTFNARIHRTGADQDGVLPLADADARPSRWLNAAKLDYLWTTSDARRLQGQLQQLRGSGRYPVPLSTRAQPQWRDQADRFIADLDHWNGAREPDERDYFYQKGLLFTEVLNLMPSSTARTRGLRAFIDFVRRTDMERNRRTLWAVFLNQLLELAHGGDRNYVLEAMEASGHPTLSLYARLERIFPKQTRPRPGAVDRGLGFSQEPRNP